MRPHQRAPKKSASQYVAPTHEAATESDRAHEREARRSQWREAPTEVLERFAEGQMHSLLERSDAVPWQARADSWRFTRIGRRVVQLLGYPLERWYEPDFWISHIHPDDRERVMEAYRQSVAQRQDFEIEYRVLSCSGHSVWIRAVVNITYPADQPALLRGIFIDISDHRRLLDALRESQQRYALATAGGGVSVWDYDPASGHLHVDPLMPFLLGFEAGELRSRTDWLARIHPADRERLLARERCVLRDAAPADADGMARLPATTCRVYHKDGSTRWFLSSGVVLRCPDGTPQRVIGTVTDVTARMREARARRAAEVLHRAVLASLPGRVAVVDRSGVIIAVNRAWRRLANATRADPAARAFVGTSYLEVCRRAARAGDASAGATLEGIESVLNGAMRRWRCEYETASLTDRHWFVVLVKRLARPAGGAVITHFNVTRRRRAELAAEQRQQEVAHMARLATMGELAAPLAHQLNQPLAAMMSNAQTAARLLAADEPRADEVRAILADIMEDDRRAGEVIRCMRALVGRKDDVFAPINLNDVVRDTTRLLSSDAIIRQTTLSTELDPQIPLVRGDQVQLQQVVLNLIINALDAAGEVPPGARTVVVRTQRVGADAIELAVTDNGPGLSPMVLQHLFEPFYTTKRDGLGLGLSIAQSIVDARGGTIRAENLPGNGAALRVTLPTTDAVLPGEAL